MKKRMIVVVVVVVVWRRCVPWRVCGRSKKEQKRKKQKMNKACVSQS